MLYIHIRGWEEKCVRQIDSFFNRHKREEWFGNPVVQRIIKDIDNTEVVQGEVLKSPVFGIMSPDRLSTGCKATILLETMPGINVYATRCGDNCVPDILEIASRKDITITLHHCMRFPDEFEAHILETGNTIHSFDEFVDEYYRKDLV